MRGFLCARSADGKLIAAGDLSQVVRGDRVISHTVFHFKDGSIDDETTVYTQHTNFQLISDRHIQRGPFFPHPMDVTIDAPSGQVTVRTTGKHGKEEVNTAHLSLPSDLANGLTSVIAKNLLPHAPATTVPVLVATPKLRLVKIVYTARGDDPLSIAGMGWKATRFEMKVDLGGVAGVVAPLIGKQPPDLGIWILGGEAPAFVRQLAYLYQGGPMLTFELASPVWPQSPDGKIVSPK